MRACTDAEFDEKQCGSRAGSGFAMQAEFQESDRMKRQRVLPIERHQRHRPVGKN